MANEGSISWAAHLGGAVTGRVRIYSTKYDQLNFEPLGRECFKNPFHERVIRSHAWCIVT